MAAKSSKRGATKRRSKVNHETRHSLNPLDLGSIALASSILAPRKGDFVPTPNQLAALAFVGLERKAIRNWSMIADGIHISTQSVHEWRTNPLFLDWWSAEIQKQQKARAHTMTDIMEEIAQDETARQADKLAAAKAYQKATGDVAIGADTSMGVLLGILGQGGELSVQATRGDTGDTLEVHVDTRDPSPAKSRMDDLVGRAASSGACQVTPENVENLVVDTEFETRTDKMSGRVGEGPVSDNGRYEADKEAADVELTAPNIGPLKDRASALADELASGGGGSKITRPAPGSQSTPCTTASPDPVLHLTCPDCGRLLCMVRYCQKLWM